MREDQMTPEERRILRRRKAPAIHRWEQELRAQLDLAPERFRRVRWRSEERRVGKECL